MWRITTLLAGLAIIGCKSEAQRRAEWKAYDQAMHNWQDDTARSQQAWGQATGRNFMPGSPLPYPKEPSGSRPYDPPTIQGTNSVQLREIQIGR
jgi:hypothetical protein